MESQGTGVHVVMSAATALKIGAPIRAVIAYTATATCAIFLYRLACADVFDK